MANHNFKPEINEPRKVVDLLAKAVPFLLQKNAHKKIRRERIWEKNNLYYKAAPHYARLRMVIVTVRRVKEL